MPRNYPVGSRNTEPRKGRVIQVEKEGTACAKAVVEGSLGELVTIPVGKNLRC